MKRDLQALTEQIFDIVVIGAGIYGAAIARRAAQHDLSVALIDQGDFGAGTSANSLKILHGGLRHLQHGDLPGLRASITARRRWFRMAPHLVTPCAFVTPSYGRGRHSSLAFRGALAVNDLVGYDRNRGLDASIQIPPGRMMSRDEVLRIAPGLRGTPLTGGAVWFDGLIWNTERMTLAFVLSAVAYGARAANYARAKDYVVEKGRLVGVSVTDVLSGREFLVRAGTVINASGPWLGELGEPGGSAADMIAGTGWAKAVNVVVGRKLFPDHAVGLSAAFGPVSERAIGERGDRFYFFVPWRGHTMIGTTYRWAGQDGGRCGITATDVRELVEAANMVYPDADLSPADVIFAHTGFLPASCALDGRSEEMRLTRCDRIRVASGPGAAGSVIAVSGVKYTGAIAAADRVVRLLRKTRGERSTRLRDDGVVWGGETLPPGALGDEDTAHVLRADQRQHLLRTYGSKFGSVLRYLERNVDGARTLGQGQPQVQAEVLHAIHEEMAVRLDDVVLRRLDLGAHGYPGYDTINACGAIMARELGWGPDRLVEEVERVASEFRGRCFGVR